MVLAAWYPMRTSLFSAVAARAAAALKKILSLNYSSINKKKGAKNIANRYITGS